MVLILDSQAKHLKHFFGGGMNYSNFTTFFKPCGGHCSYSGCSNGFTLLYNIDYQIMFFYSYTVTGLLSYHYTFV